MADWVSDRYIRCLVDAESFIVGSGKFYLMTNAWLQRDSILYMMIDSVKCLVYSFIFVNDKSVIQVSVIQPVSGCGLAILSIFSHFYLQEVMNVIDWLGITLAGIGTIGNPRYHIRLLPIESTMAS